MLLRRFNQAGIDMFAAYIKTLVEKKKVSKSSRDLADLPAPMNLLTDDTMTEVVTPHTECPNVSFSNRLSAAEYLDRLLSPIGLADSFHDDKLWAWLSLRFFDELMPFKKEGIPSRDLSKLGVDESRFIPSNHFQDRHRHLLRHPLQVYRAVHGEAQNALCFLVQPVYRPGDIVEQFGSRQLYSWNTLMLSTMSALLVDSAEMKIRPNASGKARRLESVLNQFDCTWDLGYIAKDLLVPMLPKEFKELRRTRPASKKVAK